MCEQRISASHLPFPSEIEEGNIINMGKRLLNNLLK